MIELLFSQWWFWVALLLAVLIGMLYYSPKARIKRYNRRTNLRQFEKWGLQDANRRDRNLRKIRADHAKWRAEEQDRKRRIAKVEAQRKKEERERALKQKKAQRKVEQDYQRAKARLEHERRAKRAYRIF